MASRPRLKPYFRPLRRGPDTVQLGLSAGSGGVVLRGLGPVEVALLTRLDGTRTETELVRDATGRGMAPERVAALVTLLREHHLLDEDLDGAGPDRIDLGRLPGATFPRGALGAADAPTLPLAGPGTTRQLLHLTGRRVVVSGRGRLPWVIGSLLRTTGVGQVDLGSAAVHALDQALRDDPGTDPPDLVVLVGSEVLDPRSGDPWWRRGVPTLPVVTDGRRIVVGPLVGDPSGPCLHCLDLDRADRDAAWPALLAQVSERGGDPGDDEVSSESTLSAMASGVVAMIVTAHLAGDRSPAGVSVEMSLPWPRLDHRRWVRHRQCAAHPATRHTGSAGESTPDSAPALSPTESSDPRARSVAARETMER